MSELSILTPKGYGKVDRIFLSELGFFMLKISFEMVHLQHITSENII